MFVGQMQRLIIGLGNDAKSAFEKE